jgi:nitroimidazol reductase NimA-like FMN-containing flavoprotein (pyridoxamine 5'-phosphate oxidase superfamily)
MSESEELKSESPVRRKDRAVIDEEWICNFLETAPHGVLATSLDRQPYLTPNLFVFDRSARAIYLHTARIGRTKTNTVENPRVCFCVSQMGRLLPAEVALEFSVEYASVIVFGSGSIVVDAEEARKAMQMLLDKYFPHLSPGRDYRPITKKELDRTAVFKISILEWSAKEKRESLDFPGAFVYPAARQGNPSN